MMKSDITGPYLKVNGKIRGYCELCGREVGLDEPGNKCPLCGAELYYEPKVCDMYKYGKKHPEFVKKINDICEKGGQINGQKR